MTRLSQLLNDVLEGRRLVNNVSTFNLLRRFAPDKTAELDRLEAEAVARRAAKALDNPVPTQTRFTRSDVDAILHQRRPASIDELEQLVVQGNDHQVLSVAEELELRNLIARRLARRHIGEVRDPNEEFIATVVGTVRTPLGDLTREELDYLDSIRRLAIHAIEKCPDHRRKQCDCWSECRAQLWEVRRTAEDRSPFGKAALAAWNFVENFASSYQKPTTPPVSEPPTTPMRTDIPGSESMTPYNWRYWKTPTESKS